MINFDISENVLNAIVSFFIYSVFVFLIIWFYFWGVGYRETQVELEKIKAEACAVEYSLSNTQRYISLDYCPNRGEAK